MENRIDRNDMPVGFTMALGMNPSAMTVFSGLNEQQKRKILQQARQATSESEMQTLVNRLTEKLF